MEDFFLVVVIALEKHGISTEISSISQHIATFSCAMLRYNAKSTHFPALIELFDPSQEQIFVQRNTRHCGVICIKLTIAIRLADD